MKRYATQNERAYLPGPAVRQRYGISDMTLWRWERDERLGFPRAMRIGRRRFYKLADLEDWERKRAGARAA